MRPSLVAFLPRHTVSLTSTLVALYRRGHWGAACELVDRLQRQSAALAAGPNHGAAPASAASGRPAVGPSLPPRKDSSPSAFASPEASLLVEICRSKVNGLPTKGAETFVGRLRAGSHDWEAALSSLWHLDACNALDLVRAHILDSSTGRLACSRATQHRLSALLDACLSPMEVASEAASPSMDPRHRQVAHRTRRDAFAAALQLADVGSRLLRPPPPTLTSADEKVTEAGGADNPTAVVMSVTEADRFVMALRRYGEWPEALRLLGLFNGPRPHRDAAIETAPPPTDGGRSEDTTKPSLRNAHGASSPWVSSRAAVVAVAAARHPSLQAGINLATQLVADGWATATQDTLCELLRRCGACQDHDAAKLLFYHRLLSVPRDLRLYVEFSAVMRQCGRWRDAVEALSVLRASSWLTSPKELREAAAASFRTPQLFDALLSGAASSSARLDDEGVAPITADLLKETALACLDQGQWRRALKICVLSLRQQQQGSRQDHEASSRDDADSSRGYVYFDSATLATIFRGAPTTAASSIARAMFADAPCDRQRRAVLRAVGSLVFSPTAAGAVSFPCVPILSAVCDAVMIRLRRQSPFLDPHLTTDRPPGRSVDESAAASSALGELLGEQKVAATQLAAAARQMITDAAHATVGGGEPAEAAGGCGMLDLMAMASSDSRWSGELNGVLDRLSEVLAQEFTDVVLRFGPSEQGEPVTRIGMPHAVQMLHRVHGALAAWWFQTSPRIERQRGASFPLPAWTVAFVGCGWASRPADVLIARRQLLQTDVDAFGVGKRQSIALALTAATLADYSSALPSPDATKLREEAVLRFLPVDGNCEGVMAADVGRWSSLLRHALLCDEQPVFDTVRDTSSPRPTTAQLFVHTVWSRFLRRALLSSPFTDAERSWLFQGAMPLAAGVEDAYEWSRALSPAASLWCAFDVLGTGADGVPPTALWHETDVFRLYLDNRSRLYVLRAFCALVSAPTAHGVSSPLPTVAAWRTALAAAAGINLVVSAPIDRLVDRRVDDDNPRSKVMQTENFEQAIASLIRIVPPTQWLVAMQLAQRHWAAAGWPSADVCLAVATRHGASWARHAPSSASGAVTCGLPRSVAERLLAAYQRDAILPVESVVVALRRTASAAHAATP